MASSTLYSFSRTAVPIWSPSTLPSPTPLLATGTVSGALDASFSADSVLDLWDPFASSSVDELTGELKPAASLSVPSRFHRLAWGYVKAPERPKGVIAAGFDNGTIGLWDPSIILEGKGKDPLIASHEMHKGAVRGLDFNLHQTNLLASGATNGEIYIWDLTTPNKPFSPGSRSRSIDDITTLHWNSHVAHVLATGSNSGYTVVWDLKSKREVTALSYTAPGGGQQQGFGGAPWGAQGKRSVSCVQWHPDNPTKLVTATDDDSYPVIMLWDLRNWKEPEKILTGHEKGILSLSWCAKDSDLLLSCGKDGRTLAWNPTTGDIVAELPPSSNWSFDVQWCPKNPSILSTASLDGKVSIQSIQATRPAETEGAAAAAAQDSSATDGAGMFEAAISANAANWPTKSLSQPPKWLQRPASASFGFGGKLVSVSTTGGKSTVRVSSVVGEPDIVERALKLEQAASADELLAEFCAKKSAEFSTSTSIPDDLKEGEIASWKLLSTLFDATEENGTTATSNRSQLVTLLGFSKEEVKAKVEEAIKTLKDKLPATSQGMSKTMSSGAISGLSNGSDLDDSVSIAREPLVTFAETTASETLSGSSEGEGAAANDRADGGADDIPSVSGASDFGKLVSEAETEVTEPSLFGEDVPAATGAQSAAAADFYRQIGSGRPAALPDHVFRSTAANSSVAATVGSASSVASLNLKPTTFKIYPSEESDVERLVTKALVLGDFESAVELSLSTERYADAILLAVRGGPELLAKAQKAYFERKTTSLPYLRIYQSIVTDDLNDVVQNADLSEWQEIFVVLCTFAKPDEFPSLLEQLGQRLEYQYSLTSTSPTPERAPEFRKNAILCYLAAGRLERVVGIWLQQMKEEEKAAEEKAGGQLATAKYATRARTLQSFIEKVTVFQQAVKYVDVDLAQPTESTEVAESGARTYKLAALYDRYVEYAELLAAQGLATVAVKYIAQTPVDHRGSSTSAPSSPTITRERLARATGQKTTAPTSAYGVPAKIPQAAPVAAQSSRNTYSTGYQPAAPLNQQQQQQPSGYTPYSAQPAPVANGRYDDPYGVSQQSSQSAYGAPQPVTSYAPQPGQYGVGTQQQSAYCQQSQPSQPYQNGGGASSFSPYASTTSTSNPYAPGPPAPISTPPVFGNHLPDPSSLPPPPTRSKSGWNDAPVIDRKQTPAAVASAKPTPIASPFPNQQPMSPPVGYAQPQGPGGVVPPPPPSRGGTRTPAQANAPPPPRGPQGYQPQQQPMPPPPLPNQNHGGPPPPQGAYGRPQQQGSMPPPPPPPGQRGPAPPGPYGQQGQQGQFRGAPTPPPGHGPPRQQQQQAPPPPGPYGPPAPAQNSGPYAPAPGSQPGPYGPPPPQAGPPGGPGQQRPAPPTGPYAPPPGQQRPPGPPGPPGAPPLRAGSNLGPNARPASPAQAPAPPKPEPPKSKYPPGDRTHIPDNYKPIFGLLSNEIRRLRQLTPPQQKKMVDDTERRLNALFDLLNEGDKISKPVGSRLLEICKAIETRNQPAALDLHLKLLTSGEEVVSVFQAALKLIIQRMER